ncbi:MAG: amidohydrolase family protein [Myxococcota bacterium]
MRRERQAKDRERRRGGRFARVTATIGLCLAAAACAPSVPVPSGPPAELVLRGGRVVDPETGLDGLRDVAIEGGRIVAISQMPLAGDRVVDVRGLVVAPGFIDLHRHDMTPLGQRFQVRDGVTTGLELEAGSYPVASLGTHAPLDFAKRPLGNFGASTGHAWLRGQLLLGEDAASNIGDVYAHVLREGGGGGLDGPAFKELLPDEQLPALRDGLRRGLEEGGLGIGLLLDYMSSAVSDAELRVVFEVAAERGAPVFVHVRRGVAGDPTGLDEVLDLARETGAPVHVCHVQSSAMGAIDTFLDRIRAARRDGVRVTTESFPYNAGSTAITAAVFDRDWQRIFGISYGDVQWAETGEWLTEETWHDYRRRFPGGAVIHHYNREEWTRVATLAPDVIVASDGLPVLSFDVAVPPFGIGTFGKVLRKYVREEESLSLMDALAKMTLGPARVLEDWAPVFRRKGRVQVGADADLTVFDPDTVQDHATFEEPFRASTGFEHVLVRGVFVVEHGEVVDGVAPGKRLLARTSR